ncbi:uncharacterized protein LOC134266242 [Saccostrea cucullata]|uniref:uncharacterized protein LOC134266242 n=1 Tax=Saccostrea cuccullata TaxID=36930 RepID=UPI002ED3D1C5
MPNLCISIQLLLFLARNAATLPCPQSRQTMSPVLSCPTNEDEWKRRSAEKNCSRFQQQCPEGGDSVYHCVLNSFINETLEVCAPEVRIIGSRCVEYNVRGAIIQESPYLKCNSSCPFSYLSTAVYKYHECFENVDRKTKNATSLSSGYTEKYSDYSAETTWQIVALVMICLNVAFFIVILWTVMTKKKLERKLTQQEVIEGDTSEGEEKQENREVIEGDTSEGEEKQENREVIEGDTSEGEEKQENREDTAIDIRSIKREDADGSPDVGKGIYVAALDIGNQHLTMALAYPDPYQGVKPIGSVERISIFREENGHFKPFSPEDLHAFAKRDRETTSWKYHYQFKLSKETSNEREYEGILKSILERFNYTLENGKDNVRNVAKERLFYAVIVPKYWSEKAKNRLRNCIFEMKIVQDMDPDNTSIITREDTLSPFIQYANARVLCLNFKVDNLILDTSKSSFYGILHIGSHYCDLNFRLVGEDAIPDLPKQRLEWEILPDEKIFDLLSEIFTERVFKDWKKQYENCSIQLITEFEKKIKSYRGGADGVAFEMKLPETLLKLAKEKYPLKESDIKKSIEKRKNICLKTPDDWIIQFQTGFIRECFQELRTKVEKMINNAQETFNEQNVKCVVMTGTYSNMEMIRTDAEKSWFKNLKLEVTIAIPENYQVFAMGGAYCVQNKLQQQRHGGNDVFN